MSEHCPTCGGPVKEVVIATSGSDWGKSQYEADTAEVERLKALLREMMEDYLVLVRDGPWPVMSQGHADSGNLVKRVREALSEG